MAIQHRDSAILSTSGEIASAVRAVGQLHCEARRAYDEPADWRLYEDEIRSVEGRGALSIDRQRQGNGPTRLPFLESWYSLRGRSCESCS